MPERDWDSDFKQAMMVLAAADPEVRDITDWLMFEETGPVSEEDSIYALRQERLAQRIGQYYCLGKPEVAIVFAMCEENIMNDY